MLKPKQSNIHCGYCKQKQMRAVDQMAACYTETVFITICLTKQASSSSFNLPIMKQPMHIFFYFFPTITTFHKHTLFGRQAFSKHSGVFSPLSFPWLHSLSNLTYLFRTAGFYLPRPSCCEIMYSMCVSSPIDHVDIYHSLTSTPSYGALIITAELDHSSQWRWVDPSCPRSDPGSDVTRWMSTLGKWKQKVFTGVKYTGWRALNFTSPSLSFFSTSATSPS